MLIAPKYAPLAASEKATSTPKNRVRGFCDEASGQASGRAASAYESAPGYSVCSYELASGRPFWLNRDTIGENGGINLYRYCLNNPINYKDPRGEGLLGALVDGAIGLVSGITGALVQPGATLGSVIEGAAVGAGVGAGFGLLDPTEGILSEGLVGLAVSSTLGALSGATANFVGQIVTQSGSHCINLKKVNYFSIEISAAIGFASGGMGFTIAADLEEAGYSELQAEVYSSAYSGLADFSGNAALDATTQSNNSDNHGH